MTSPFFNIYLKVQLGIDNLFASGFQLLKDKNIGLLTNIAATDSQLKPSVSIFLNSNKFNLKFILAPEHGLFSVLQDQIFVKNGKHGKIPVISVYGHKTIPPLGTLKEIDCAVIDLIDIGCRYYTFIWSAVLLLKQMAKLHKKVIILDRPNPINGITVQGPVLKKEFVSFVGLYPLPVRHGMTIGEICNMLNKEYNFNADIEIIKMEGWKRKFYFSDTGLYWTLPSPNMPSFETALVYPGMCLLEGTNLSEGRGTTRPFEIFGAPYIDEDKLTQILNRKNLPGVVFRPLKFIPTFHKYKGQVCGGAQIYVNDLNKFDPVYLGLEIISTIKQLYPKKFDWSSPPYEFEKEKLPFDILIGNSWIREMIERGVSVRTIKEKWQKELIRFNQMRKKYLLYH